MKIKWLRNGQQLNIAAMNQLFYILCGVKRTQGNSFSRPRQAPITTNHLNLIRNYLQCSCLPIGDKYMLLSAVTLAFFLWVIAGFRIYRKLYSFV